MIVYHSTGIKNANKIKKNGVIKPYTYFSPDLKKSKYYGSMYGRYKTFAVTIDNDKDWIKQEYYQNIVEINNFKII